jgi:hypothetical protein
MNNNELKRVGGWDKKDDLKRLKLKNGDTIPDVDSYLFDDEENDKDD